MRSQESIIDCLQVTSAFLSEIVQCKQKFLKEFVIPAVCTAEEDPNTIPNPVMNWKGSETMIRQWWSNLVKLVQFTWRTYHVYLKTLPSWMTLHHGCVSYIDANVSLFPSELYVNVKVMLSVRMLPTDLRLCLIQTIHALIFLQPDSHASLLGGNSITA